MDYTKIALGLKYGFLIDSENKDILENKELWKNSHEKLIEVLLWKTIWQCDEYFIPSDFFGPEPGANPKVIQLAMSTKNNFNYIIRRIIIENIAMDTFLLLGSKIHSKDRIIDGIKYVSMFSENGYYEMTTTGKLGKDRKINKEVTEKRKKELYYQDPIGMNPRYNTIIREYNHKFNLFLKNKYVELCKEHNPFFKEYFLYTEKRKGKENIQIPAFECKQIATALKEQKMLNLTRRILIENDTDKKLQMIKEHRKLVHKLEFPSEDSNYPKKTQKQAKEENDNSKKMRDLDNNIYNYYLEKYLHGKLQDEIMDICNELYKNYGLESSIMDP